MAALKRLINIVKYGVGGDSRERKMADKAALRRQQFENEATWNHGDDVVKRKYDSYDDYVRHQTSKLDQIVHRLEETEADDYAEFVRRFEACEPLNAARSVLCLGARIGTEVRALRDLGYFAVGIDLNPGPDNAYVLIGDFHDLAYADGSVDAVYTNALDHGFDLDKLLAEVGRVLRPGGLFLVDLLLGYEEGFLPGKFESTHWRNHKDFVENIRQSGGFELQRLVDLGPLRRDHWMQAQLNKPA